MYAVSMYYEDFEVGARYPTYGRTITEGDLIPVLRVRRVSVASFH